MGLTVASILSLILSVKAFINERLKGFQIGPGSGLIFFSSVLFFWLENPRPGKGDCVTLGKSCGYLMVDPGLDLSSVANYLQSTFPFSSLLPLIPHVTSPAEQ